MEKLNDDKIQWKQTSKEKQLIIAKTMPRRNENRQQK